MNLEKKLQKSRLGEAYAGIHNDADRQAVLRVYDTLLKENDLSNKMLARHMAGSILPSVAMYRGLQEQGWKSVEPGGSSALPSLTLPSPWQSSFRDWESCRFSSHCSGSCARRLQKRGMGRRAGSLNGSATTPMPSNGTATPACTPMCSDAMGCRS